MNVFLEALGLGIGLGLVHAAFLVLFGPSVRKKDDLYIALMRERNDLDSEKVDALEAIADSVRLRDETGEKNDRSSD